MKARVLRSDGLLLVTAAVWGFAFVAQRAGMAHVGPFTFNGVRFTLGALVLVPVILLRRRGRDRRPATQPLSLAGVLAAGAVLFLGSSLQQIGLVYTTAGKAGFITGLYVLLVPILGLFVRHRPAWGTWAGAALAVPGLYFLSVTDALRLAPGDGWVALGAAFWALHVLIIARLSPGRDPYRLASAQFAVTGALSLVVAFLVEAPAADGLRNAALPILYGGVMSVGVAFTLQVVAQREAPPAHAAVLMSLETVFAALGGAWLLGETLGSRGLFGCGLLLAGMLLSQVTRRPRSALGLSTRGGPG